jgi:hypothetical protein
VSVYTKDRTVKASLRSLENKAQWLSFVGDFTGFGLPFCSSFP